VREICRPRPRISIGSRRHKSEQTAAHIVLKIVAIHIRAHVHVGLYLCTGEHMNAPKDKLLLSLDEVKDLTGVGRTNLYREIHEKRLRARKQGAKTVVTREDLLSWISNLPDFSDRAQ
jgi:excisionase family DNA binding protein